MRSTRPTPGEMCGRARSGPRVLPFRLTNVDIHQLRSNFRSWPERRRLLRDYAPSSHEGGRRSGHGSSTLDFRKGRRPPTAFFRAASLSLSVFPRAERPALWQEGTPCEPGLASFSPSPRLSSASGCAASCLWRPRTRNTGRWSAPTILPCGPDLRLATRGKRGCRTGDALDRQTLAHAARPEIQDHHPIPSGCDDGPSCPARRREPHPDGPKRRGRRVR